MDSLRIKDLVVFANHGVFAAEKELGQKFVLDLNLTYDMTKAALTGDLAQSVHYGDLAQQVTTWFSATSYDLIEAAAYELVEKIFTHYPLVQALEVTVKKPWAPVHLPLETCSVTLRREKRRVLVGLGTNMGDKVANLATARQKLEDSGFVITKASSLLETEPWGGVEQDGFLNQVLEIETWQPPQTLLAVLMAIELEMGRVREVKWGPRLIDLDILFIEDQIIHSDDLVVPHPYVAERDFVLQSLVELVPHFTHPVLKKSMRQLLEDLD